MPIINPLWFYLIEFFSNVRTFLLWLGIIIVISVCIHIFLFLANSVDTDSIISEQKKKAGEEKNDKIYKDFKKGMKKLKIYLFIVSILFIAIPSKDSMYKMLIADNVTYENLEKAQEIIQNSVDYLIEKTK